MRNLQTKRNPIVVLALLLAFGAASLKAESPPPPHAVLRSTLLWGGCLTLTALLFDKNLHDEFTLRDNNFINKVLGNGRYGRPGTVVEKLGEPYTTLGISGIFYGVGKWRGDTRAQRVGRAGIVATAVTGVTTLAIKWTIGRNRPYSGNDPDEYRPFNTTTAATSFPSGHSAISFTMASVIADEYDDWRVDTLSYGTAAAISLSRIYQDRHWLSDVVAGSALGIGIGKWARRRAVQKDDTLILTDGHRVYWTRRF
jgi:membrane-associated phospholipid phosphatase